MRKQQYVKTICAHKKRAPVKPQNLFSGQLKKKQLADPEITVKASSRVQQAALNEGLSLVSGSTAHPMAGPS